MAFKGQKRVTELKVCQAELIELPVGMSGCTNGGVYRDITIWIKPKSPIRPCRNQFSPMWFDDLANHFYIPTRHAKRTKRAIKTAANFSNSQIVSKNFQSVNSISRLYWNISLIRYIHRWVQFELMDKIISTRSVQCESKRITY